MALFFTRLRRLFLGVVSTLMTQLNKLAFVTSPVFYQLVYMAFSAGCIVAVMAVIRKFFDKKISPGRKMAMWAVVLTALIIPWRPESKVSVMKDVQKLQTVSYRGEYDRADMELHRMMTSNQPVPDEALLRAIEKEERLYAKSRVFDVFLPVIWLGGVAVSCLWHIISAHRLKRKIRAHTVAHGGYDDAAEDCAQLLGIKRRPTIITQNYTDSPAVTGVLRPVVLLPEYVCSCDEQTVKYILLHEMAHIKRGDMVLNSLIIILHIVYWPVAWRLLYGIRQDMELANDAAVIKLLDGERQKEYSRSLVYVLANTADNKAYGRIMYMADGTKNIRRRIEMIKQRGFFTKRRIPIAIVCAMVVFALSAVFLTESPTPAEDNSNSDGHNYYHPLPEDGSMQNWVISRPMPESDEYTGDVAKKYAMLAVQLPTGITAGPAPSENRAPIGRLTCKAGGTPGRPRPSGAWWRGRTRCRRALRTSP